MGTYLTFAFKKTTVRWSQSISAKENRCAYLAPGTPSPPFLELWAMVTFAILV
jgi:hypothetical protein